MKALHLSLAALMLLSPVAHKAFADEAIQEIEAGWQEWDPTPEELSAELSEADVEDFDYLNAEPTARINPANVDKYRLKIVVSKKSQSLSITLDGVKQGGWKVSTAGKGYSTPTGTFTVDAMNYTHRSRKYNNARMDRAIFFNGGIALHQTYGNNVGLLGTPQSHGCVRQSPANGDKLFALVKKIGPSNTVIVVQ